MSVVIFVLNARKLSINLFDVSLSYSIDPVSRDNVDIHRVIDETVEFRRALN